MVNLFAIRAHIALDYMRQRLISLLNSKTAEAKIPDCTLAELAHAFLADVMVFFTSEENQATFQEWKKQREKSVAKKVIEKT